MGPEPIEVLEMHEPLYGPGLLVAEKKNGLPYPDGSHYHIYRKEPLFPMFGNQYYSYFDGTLHIFQRTVIDHLLSSDDFPFRIEASLAANISAEEQAIPGTIDKWKGHGLAPAPNPSLAYGIAARFRTELVTKVGQRILDLISELTRRYKIMHIYKNPEVFEKELESGAKRILGDFGLQLDSLRIYNVEDTVNYRPRFNANFLQSSMELARSQLEGRNRDPGFAARPELRMESYLEDVGNRLALYLDRIFTYTPYDPASWKVRAREIDDIVRDFDLMLKDVSSSRRLTGELPAEYIRFCELTTPKDTVSNEWTASRGDPERQALMEAEGRRIEAEMINAMKALRRRLVTANGKRYYSWLD